jgi:hypothetical protein
VLGWIGLQSLIMDYVHLRRLSQCRGCRKVRMAWVKVFNCESFSSAMKSASIFWSARMRMDPEFKTGASPCCRHRWQLITCHHFLFTPLLSTDYSPSRRDLISTGPLRYARSNNSTPTMSASFAPECNQVKEYVDTI